MNTPEILRRLAAHGLIDVARAIVEPLAGGVSSDICLVSDDAHRLVVKQALPKLRVAAEWFADPIRNRYEQAYISFVAGLDASAVPHILYCDDELSFFAMEYLAPPLENWKTRLLSEPASPQWAAKAGEILGKIHAASWDNDALKKQFDTTANFHELRSEPYFLYTAERHPAVAEQMRAHVTALECNRRCLVHGDFSPKNILVSAERMVLLDCEVAWFGNPAFDTGFLLNHFFLKAAHRPEQAAKYMELADAFWKKYILHLGENNVEQTLSWLLPMLLLARVDGKSPVEYLNPAQQETVRRFALAQLQVAPQSLDALRRKWFDSLEKV